MTTRALKVYQGEDRSPVFDYTDEVVWDQVEAGHAAFQGQSTSSRFLIRDPEGETGNVSNLPAGLTYKGLAVRNLLEWQQGSNVMFHGRIGIKGYGRGVQIADRYRQVDLTAVDINGDLRGIAIIEEDRPEETDVDRVDFFAAKYLAGGAAGRPTTNLNRTTYVSGSNTVILGSNVYRQTDVATVLSEIALGADKDHFVIPRFLTSQATDGFLFYDGHDSTAFNCPYYATDRPNELAADPTHALSIVWDAGAASTEDGLEQLSGIYLVYGQGPNEWVYVTNPTVATQYGKFEEVVFDDSVDNHADAIRNAYAILNGRQYEDRTYSLSLRNWEGLPLDDSQYGSIHAGQNFRIKARAISDADDQYVTRRIADLHWKTPSPGQYIPYIKLERPIKGRPRGKGTKPGLKHGCSGVCAETFTRNVTASWGTSEFGPEWEQSNAATQNERAYVLNEDEGVLTWNIDTAGAIGTWPTSMTADLPLTLPTEVRVKWRWHDGGYLDELETFDPVLADDHFLVGWVALVGAARITVGLNWDEPSGGSTELQVYLNDGTTDSVIHTEVFPNLSKDLQYAWLALRVESGAIKGKFWFEGEAEPAWDSVTPDPNPAPAPTALQLTGLQVAGGTSAGDTRFDYVEFTQGLECQCAEPSPIGGDGEAANGPNDGTYVGARHVHEHGDQSVKTGSLHEVSQLRTAETDVDLRLAPDGAGGVEWGVDATGGGGSLSVDDYNGNIITDVTVVTVADNLTEEINPGEVYVFTPGPMPYVYPIGGGPQDVPTTALALPAAGGSYAFPFYLASPMELTSVTVRNTDAATARTWEWAVYRQNYDTFSAGEEDLVKVTNSSGTQTFTPGAASNRTLGDTNDPTHLVPGLYWCVIRNAHATNTFGLGTQAAGTMALNTAQTKTLASLANPLDFTAATWTKVTSIPGVRLNGYHFGGNVL
jgi:hypothetical protein